jgi:hypothetical protein
MAMLLVEGFDTYTNNLEYLRKWGHFTTSDSITAIDYDSTGSNFSGKCISFTSGTGITAKTTIASHSSNEVFIGFWINVGTTPGSTYELLRLCEEGYLGDAFDGTTANSRSFSFWLTTAGYVAVKQWYDTNTSVDYTGTTSVTDASWHWFEARIQWDQTTGDVETYIDGSADITVNLADTISATSPPTFAGWRWVHLKGISAETTKIDDLIVYDVTATPTGTPTSGSFPIGESKIETLFPSGSGTNTDFSVLGGGSNYQAVDDSAWVEHQRQYVYGDTNSDTDTYAFGNLSNTPDEIHTVVVDIQARKPSSTAVYAKGVAYSNSTTGVTGSFEVETIGMRVYQLEIAQDPDTSSAWTGSGVDAAEFGFRYSTS